MCHFLRVSHWCCSLKHEMEKLSSSSPPWRNIILWKEISWVSFRMNEWIIQNLSKKKEKLRCFLHYCSASIQSLPINTTNMRFMLVSCNPVHLPLYCNIFCLKTCRWGLNVSEFTSLHPCLHPYYKNEPSWKSSFSLFLHLTWFQLDGLTRRLNSCHTR